MVIFITKNKDFEKIDKKNILYVTSGEKKKIKEN